ncbi:Serine/threonine-protein kinase SMG1 [Gigaspora margarita]|uniref:Serine/threonine-protein kinase SMG1 n=1 Tax=Gigaspora margarita TaxID=4874 RepID=A0A8H4B459_GIGMA|nr:Serine/threonine-protein kinase SMG1 [Gigaspora margarita]
MMTSVFFLWCKMNFITMINLQKTQVTTVSNTEFNAEAADFISTQIIDENAEKSCVNSMKHVVNLCDSVLHLETFRTVTNKTITMDADTLQLVKRLESAMQE